jgi:cell division septation protein DedD
MRKTAILIALPVIFLGVAAGGCAGNDNNEGSSKATAPRPAGDSAPADLVGTYGMTLKPSDVPRNPPQELTDRAEKWTLKIANSGHPNGGRAFTIINDKLGKLESSNFGVVGNRILLHNEECAVAAAPVEGEYRWKLRGKKLRFTEVKNGCKDKVALTLLTSEPWFRRR